MEEIKIGAQYKCLPVGSQREVIGVVEQLYTNTAVINVTECDPCDELMVQELQNRMVVKYQDIKKCISDKSMAY